MINPASNMFYLLSINNPTAEGFYTLLALSWNCPKEVKLDVLRSLGKSAKHGLKLKGDEFLKFLRRVLDYPRRDIWNARNPLLLVEQRFTPQRHSTNSQYPETVVRSGRPNKTRLPPHVQPQTSREKLKRARSSLYGESRVQS